MENLPPENRPPDQSPRNDRRNLECIGSFKAFTQEGEEHTIEIWTHFDEVHDRNRRRVEPSRLYLMTTDGNDVDRVAQGEYRLTKNPEVSLSTDDPDAI